MNTRVHIDKCTLLKIKEVCEQIHLNYDICLMFLFTVMLGRTVIQDATASITIFLDNYTKKIWNFRIDELSHDMSCKELYKNISEGVEEQRELDADIKLSLKDETFEVNVERYFSDLLQILPQYITKILETLTSQLCSFETALISTLHIGAPQAARISGTDIEYADIGILLQDSALLNWNKIAVERIFKRNEDEGLLVQTITYRELMEAAYNVSQELQRKKISRVGIIVNNGIELAVGIVGCIMAGCTYIPVDQNISDIHWVHHIVNKTSVEGILLGSEIHDFEFVNLHKIKICISGCPNTPKWKIPEGNKTAYIIHSSGSIGIPKSIKITRKSLNNLVGWRVQQYPLGKTQSILQLLSWSFDGFYSDFYLGLCAGSKLIIPDPNLRTEINLFTFLYQREQSLMTSMVSSLFEYIVNSRTGLVTKFARVILGGEKINKSTIQKARELNPSIHIVNEYGPSENTIVSFVCDPISNEHVNCIGRPISGVFAYILDRMGHPVLPGVIGELYLGGKGLMEGYEGDTDNELVCRENEILYRSGDLVRQLENGSVEFITIKDKYAKCFGHYVDMQAVEELIKEQLPVCECCVFCSYLNGMDSLIALYVAETNIQIERLVQLALPPFAIPTDWKRVEKVVRTDSGKIDRIAMREQYEKEITQHKNVNNGSYELAKVTESVYEIFKQVTLVPISAINSNFFDIGIKSLQLLNVYYKLDKKYPDTIELIDLFEYSSISTISERIYKILKERENK